MAGGPGLEDEGEAPPQLVTVMLAKSAAIPAIASARRLMNLPCNGRSVIAFPVTAMPGKPGRLDDHPMARVGARQELALNRQSTPGYCAITRSFPRTRT
jgi:hypothetical protein